MNKKHHTFKKVVVASLVIGTAMYTANEYMIKKATTKDLLKKDNGKFYSFKYGDIFYKVSGEGKPILLIHDLNESSSGIEWFYLEKKLAKTNKVYTIDLLGCGRSDKPKLVYNNFLYVQMISDFLKDVVGEPANVIATGKSAAPVIMAAKLFEETMDKIMLINPADLVDLNEVPDFTSKLKKTVLLCPILGTFIYHILHTKDAIETLFLTEYFSNPNAHFEEICEYYYESAHRKKSGSKYLYASLQGNYVNMNINHGLSVLEKDLLIVSGEDYFESEFVPEDYAKINKNAECISIIGTSYLPQLEAPAKVMDIIQEYWK